MLKQKIILFLIILFSASLFAEPTTNNQTITPLQQSSNEQQQAAAQIQQLKQTLADMQALIANQGKQIETLMQQQGRLYAALNNKIFALQSENNDSLSSVQLTQSKPAMQSNNSQEAKAYQEAYQLLQTKQYTEAVRALDQYLQNYPNGTSAAEAYYWLGELYALAGDEDSAVQELTLLVNHYPDSVRAPEAMLKLAVMDKANQQYGQAKTWWSKIIANYPNSSAAQAAKTEIQKLSLSGQ